MPSRNFITLLLVSCIELLVVPAFGQESRTNNPLLSDTERQQIRAEMCLAAEAPGGGALYIRNSSLKWTNGSTLKVSFLGGSTELQAAVIRDASEWSKYANITFQRVATGGDVRISFERHGYYSQIGRLAKSVSPTEPTMVLGFAQGVTENEIRRVTLHEFGHVLGFGHEHQSPEAGIHWNQEKVIAFFSGPPNNWSLEVIEENVLKRAVSVDAASTFDPKSIMMYPVSKALTTDGFSVGWNTELSETDKKFCELQYPKR